MDYHLQYFEFDVQWISKLVFDCPLEDDIHLIAESCIALRACFLDVGTDLGTKVVGLFAILLFEEVYSLLEQLLHFLIINFLFPLDVLHS